MILAIYLALYSSQPYSSGHKRQRILLSFIGNVVIRERVWKSRSEISIHNVTFEYKSAKAIIEIKITHVLYCHCPYEVCHMAGAIQGPF